jgi:uncharacterized protein (DUF433 family)
VQQFDRITMNPEVMGGKPCIRGMRVTVGMIVGAIAAGRSFEQVLADFPYLEEPDIREALAFAAHTPANPALFRSTRRAFHELEPCHCDESAQ